MAPLKRKRPHDAAAPAPGAPPSPEAIKSTSSVTRRATRQSLTEAPAPPLWAADPEPRRRRRASLHGTAVSDSERGWTHNQDENEHEEIAIPVLERKHKEKHKKEDKDKDKIKNTKASLRSGYSGETRSAIVAPTAPNPRSAALPASTHAPAPSAPAPAPKSAAPGPGRGRGRGRGRSRAGSSAQLGRPVLHATNQADPALRPKPIIRNRALRHQQRHNVHNNDDAADADAADAAADDQIDALVKGDTNGSVAPMHVDVAAPADPGRRGSAVDPPVVTASQPPARTAQKQHPPLATAKTVPIMAQAQPQPRAVKISDHVAANTSKPFTSAAMNATNATSATQSPPTPAKKQQPAKQNFDQKKSSTVERNIDKVVFGNVCFSTWYHSPYGTEALGEISGNSIKANSVSGVYDGGSKEEALSNPSNRKTKEERLDRLYVCPSCFKYSKELVPWWQHVHLCERRRGDVPGQKIYTHPKGPRARQLPAGTATSAASKGPGRKKKNMDGSAQVPEDEVEDQGEWSIYEVDGEEEGLFCQNLSLFAKLFLDNKSVFFDVVGFNYFLLVYTSPHLQSGNHSEPLPPKHQIVGFFSKEKLSWDNNNLACILVFPPWQRKGLGALLMGISYEISRREGMLGGPEKPISDLGKKGYKRFWAGEIAAWLLNIDTSGEDEVVIDVDECSKATWIVPEDCLMILREMGIVEEAGVGPPQKKRRKYEDASTLEDGEVQKEAVGQSEKDEEVKDVPRVRISKEAVWAWVQANRISLEKACDPEGFVEGYAIKETGVEEEDL